LYGKRSENPKGLARPFGFCVVGQRRMSGKNNNISQFFKKTFLTDSTTELEPLLIPVA